MVKLVGKEVGNVGYGLMGLTWRESPPSQEQSFEAMRTALSLGANAWNGGEIYGTPERNSLHLLNEYFTKYPQDAEKVVLSVKGGIVPGTLEPDGSKQNTQRSIDECLKVLDGKKFLDIYESARVDPNVPIEETIGYIAEYVKAGKVGGIGLSEVNANTIRRAHKIHPIVAVEIEFSLWTTNPLENGVAETCAELGIPIVAYSPLGRGVLTGKYKSFDELPATFTRMLPRFQGAALSENLKLVQEVEKLASAKGVTAGQVAIGWVVAQSRRNGLGDIIPIPGATTSERIKENTKAAQLSEEDLAALAEILKKFPVIGDRYPEGMPFLDG